MTTPTDAQLAEFPPDAVTSRVLGALYGAVPYSPPFAHWAAVDDAARALQPGADAGALGRARQIAASDPEVQDILWMSRLLDAGDKGYAMVTGLVSAYKLFKGHGADALETDSQQRNDAVLKALGLAYMVYKAYPGSLSERATAFRTSPSGQALAIYYGAIEVALPFADNAVDASADQLGNLLGSEAGEQAARLDQLAGAHETAHAGEMLGALTGQLQRVATHTSKYVKPVADAVGPYLPSALQSADKAAGVVANAADVLPVYRLLGARLAAEAAARKAGVSP